MVKTVPQLVVEAACALYGEQWRSPMSHSLDLQPRTVRKIGKAAMTGEPHPVSPGILMELATLAREHAAAISAPGAETHSRARFETIAAELDEAVRVWTSTRRRTRAS